MYFTKNQPFKMYLPKPKKKCKSVNKMRNKLVERAKIMVIFNIITFFSLSLFLTWRIFMRFGRSNEIFWRIRFYGCTRNQKFTIIVASLSFSSLYWNSQRTKIHRYVMTKVRKKSMFNGIRRVCAYVRWIYLTKKNVDW